MQSWQGGASEAHLLSGREGMFLFDPCAAELSVQGMPSWWCLPAVASFHGFVSTLTQSFRAVIHWG